MNTSKTNFLKPGEIAKILRLNQITIYGYIQQGRLRAVRFGRKYRVDERDLELFIKQNVVKV